MPTTKTLVTAPEQRERRAALGMTGRYLVTFSKDAHQEVSAKLAEAGFQPAKPLAPGAAAAKALARGAQLSLPHVGVAVVDALPEQEKSLHGMAAATDSVLALEPERIVRAVSPKNVSDYVRGWRDGVDALADKLVSEKDDRPISTPAAASSVLVTWGLTASKVTSSRFTGRDIKLAVLDTGFDVQHPDFAARVITTKNFVGDNKPFHDGVGHGTHCIGTAGGPLHPQKGPRYGVAGDALIYAGRVLDDTGRGGDFNILQGIDWAIEQGCQLVSLSLGAPWFPGDPAFSNAYEAAAQRALDAGCLLIVAAGNEADDPRYIGAIGTPGNSPSVLTVAAVNSSLATAPFSNRIQTRAPGVKGPDLAGPGVDIYSAWPVADGEYNTISGTSMATPHVAGIAALYAEADPGLRGQRLKDAILQACLGVTDGAARQGEIGRGLVQAPTGLGA